MMNLQRLAEVRSHLNNLASLATIIGPGEDLSDEVQMRLEEFGLVRRTVFVSPDVQVPEPLPLPFVVVTPPLVRIKPTAITVRVQHRRVAASTCYNPERYVPYRILWVKVIIRAAYDYALWRESNDMRLRKYALDAERWIFEESDLALSFKNICFAFDFPVERIRKLTRTLTKNDVKKLEFRERHGKNDIIGEITGGNDE